MTRLMVLGLLVKKPMSGYEMQQMMMLGHVDKWAGILPGSIYHALKKMEAEELVQIAEIQNIGNRAKAIYQITEKGRQEYLRLIEETLSNTSILLPTNLYTAMFFLRDIDSNKAIQAIETQLAQIRLMIEETNKGQKQKSENQQVPIEGLLIFEHMRKQYELYESLLEKLRQSLL